MSGGRISMNVDLYCWYVPDDTRTIWKVKGDSSLRCYLDPSNSKIYLGTLALTSLDLSAGGRYRIITRAWPDGSGQIAVMNLATRAIMGNTTGSCGFSGIANIRKIYWGCDEYESGPWSIERREVF